jgi:hypothetical protein
VLSSSEASSLVHREIYRRNRCPAAEGQQKQNSWPVLDGKMITIKPDNEKISIKVRVRKKE